MNYSEWFESHAKKHKNIVDKLIAKEYTKEQIIEYFDFDNMVKEEPMFCLLYKDNKKCHDMDSLNCYLCACPHFRFDDNGVKKGTQTEYSDCAIECKHGAKFIYNNKIHQDCTSCEIPHKKSYVLKHFNFDWKKIMNKCSK